MDLIQIIIPVKLWCPSCGARHIDDDHSGKAWHLRAHRTHRCNKCHREFNVTVVGDSSGTPENGGGAREPGDRDQ